MNKACDKRLRLWVIAVFLPAFLFICGCGCLMPDVPCMPGVYHAVRTRINEVTGYVP